MAASGPQFLPSHTERAIAVARIVLGASGLIAVWLDPAEPIRTVYLGATAALLIYLGRRAIRLRTEIAAREQRILLAHDLHDGVLQSLTGIRFELQAVASTLGDDTAAAGRDRLLAIERALAIEQRELRLFIDHLKPQESGSDDGALADRLHALRERVALEWKVPVTIRVTPEPFALSAELQQAVPLMAHEAIVNAVKHAQPTRISVDVQIDGRLLRLLVCDDGSGFPFRGRYPHQALVDGNLGPASLRERAASLGGEMSIESSANGSKVEIAVPLG